MGMKSMEAAPKSRDVSFSQRIRCVKHVRWIATLIFLFVCFTVSKHGPNPWIRTSQPRLYSHDTLQFCSSIRSPEHHEEANLCEVLRLHYIFDTQSSPIFTALEDVHYALEIMQTNYFALGVGTWPTSIDWTAAIFSTLMSASLGSLTRFLEYLLPSPAEGPLHRTAAYKGIQVENEINRYFSQSIAYYFGENAWDIRFEAYDDMLWVVLGWLENIRFIRLHASFHFPEVSKEEGLWYGEQFIPGFAHRARVFYDLTKQGWDTKLCGGGMIWNPRLSPYKNAITNQLFVSASVNMYLHFPGDNDTSPFLTRTTSPPTSSQGSKPIQFPAHDPSYLQYAIDAYDWLRRSNMTNDLGLYVDGFHIRDYGINHTIGTGNCDERNEMVYTYNQGVILSGLRGLWESTNRLTYLEDGHQLIRNVIKATGWTVPGSDDDDDHAFGPYTGNNNKRSNNNNNNNEKWSGLGRNGILEDLCDASGRCSQDSQTFKGIFFHHLTLFCAPLPLTPVIPGVSFGASKEVAGLHAQSCREYAGWVAHNAIAAMGTRDEMGRFGMWWGVRAAAGGGRGQVEEEQEEGEALPVGAVDYRNMAVAGSGSMQSGADGFDFISVFSDQAVRASQQGADEEISAKYGRSSNASAVFSSSDAPAGALDLNGRGRGRTVETQSGGLAVVRAMWEIVQMFRRPERD